MKKRGSSGRPHSLSWLGTAQHGRDSHLHGRRDVGMHDITEGEPRAMGVCA